MFQEDKAEVKQMISEAIAGIKIPEVKEVPVFDDSGLKREIAKLKDEIISLDAKIIKAKPKKIGG